MQKKTRKPGDYKPRECEFCGVTFKPKTSGNKHCSIKCRLLSKVDKQGDCWEYTGCINPYGYGVISIGRVEGRSVARFAHRVSYQEHIGEIPDGLQLDHLCRNRKCVNPEHLEPVTNKENTDRGMCAEVNRARKLNQTHCKRGHPLSGKNLYRHPNGKRHCRTCAQIYAGTKKPRVKYF